jgi:hypothetical protein
MCSYRFQPSVIVILYPGLPSGHTRLARYVAVHGKENAIIIMQAKSCRDLSPSAGFVGLHARGAPVLPRLTA